MFLDMHHTLFLVHSFVDIVNLVVHYSYLIQPFCCSRLVELVLVFEGHVILVNIIETSVKGLSAYHAAGVIVGTCSERYRCLLLVLPIMLVD